MGLDEKVRMGLPSLRSAFPSRAAQSSSKPDPKGLPSLRSAFPMDRIQPKKKRLRGARSLPFAFCILPPYKQA